MCHECDVTGAAMLTRARPEWSWPRPCSLSQVPAYTLGCAVSAIARCCELMVPQPQVPKLIHRTICALEQLQPVQVPVQHKHARLCFTLLLTVADSLDRVAGGGFGRCSAAARLDGKA